MRNSLALGGPQTAPVAEAPTHDAARGLIGPNAVTRIAEALVARHGEQRCREVFEFAGLARYLADPPARMVPEPDVAALHRALIATLGEADAAAVGAAGGQLTGDYLLAHRIPAIVQLLLRRLPRPIAARLLARAIARHAWTFAGSGMFTWSTTPGLTLNLAGALICRRIETAASACPYLAATFQRLFGAILRTSVEVRETSCEARGAPACAFRVTWTR